MTTAQPPARTQIPVSKITIDQIEGIDGKLLKTTVFTWAEANAILRQIQTNAPKAGGTYWKTDVVVTWADGHQVSAREDVANNGKYQANLGERIRGLWLFYAGLRQPDHYTDAEYAERIIGDTKRLDAALICLKSYALDDTAGAAKPKPVTVDTKQTIAAVAATKPRMADWPTQAEIAHVQLMVAGLIKRVEDPLMRGMQNAEIIEKVRMELRKAVAALTRAEDAV